MLSVVIQALKKSVMFLCTPFAKRLAFWTHFAQLISQTGFTRCRLTWSGFEIHLITEVSVIKRLGLSEFTLWGRDLVSVVRIIEGFLKKIYENFFATLETVRNREVSVLERCPYWEVPLYLLTNLTTELINNYMYIYVMQHLKRMYSA